MFKLQNGGFGFEVMSKADIDLHAKTYSKTFESSFSPWKTNYEDMSLKTVVKKVLKFCPMKTEYVRAMEMDNALRNDLKDFEIPDGAIETDFREVV